MWFFCKNVPSIATSVGTRAYRDVWWKADHPLILKEDPGLPITAHALKYINERVKFQDDSAANTTADLSQAAASGNTIEVNGSLNALLCEYDLGNESEGEEQDDSHGDYGMQRWRNGACVGNHGLHEQAQALGTF